MKPEYRKGQEVARKFEEAMRRVFQTPKPQPQREEKQPKAATERKTEQHDRD
jgi:hypothetical protein